jgi:hypothetical protein
VELYLHSQLRLHGVVLNHIRHHVAALSEAQGQLYLTLIIIMTIFISHETLYSSRGLKITAKWPKTNLQWIHVCNNWIRKGTGNGNSQRIESRLITEGQNKSHANSKFISIPFPSGHVVLSRSVRWSRFWESWLLPDTIDRKWRRDWRWIIGQLCSCLNWDRCTQFAITSSYWLLNGQEFTIFSHWNLLISPPGNGLYNVNTTNTLLLR